MKASSELIHTAIYTQSNSRKREFVHDLLQGRVPDELSFLEGKKGEYFSNIRLEEYIEAEARYAYSRLGKTGEQELKTRSTGERKRALLNYLLRQKPDYIVLDDPFDNLDRDFQKELRGRLLELSNEITLIQLVNRSTDLLGCIKSFAFLDERKLLGFPNYRPNTEQQGALQNVTIPPEPASPSAKIPSDIPLVLMRNVCVAFSGRPVLHNINWTINRGDFWELRGPNGSGKTTLITLITGDSPKAYGQDIHLFGRAKGSGESVWDIKEHIGYFTPAMTDRFRGYHNLENMLISGLTDSIGLYQKPTENQQALSRQWLKLLGLENKAHENLRDQTYGIQRLIFCARAMIKHPPLLILDEPTAGLDDRAAQVLIQLIGKMARESNTAIVFVSHREEPGLRADKLLELHPGTQGSSAKITTS